MIKLQWWLASLLLTTLVLAADGPLGIKLYHDKKRADGNPQTWRWYVK